MPNLPTWFMRIYHPDQSSTFYFTLDLLKERERRAVGHLTARSCSEIDRPTCACIPDRSKMGNLTFLFFQ